MKPKMQKLLTIVALGLGSTAIAPLANSAAIVNGSFEADSWPTYQFDLESAGVTGWTALDPNGNSAYPWGINESAYGDTPYGAQFVVLGSYGTDAGTSIQQTISGLVAGEAYTLNFALSSEGYSGGGFSGNSNVRVSMLSGSSTASADYAAPLSVGTYWDTWSMSSYIFTASATSATFAFEDLAATGTGYDMGIDNVSIEGATGNGTVSEPASLALLGVGIVGLALRRRRRG